MWFIAALYVVELSFPMVYCSISLTKIENIFCGGGSDYLSDDIPKGTVLSTCLCVFLVQKDIYFLTKVLFRAYLKAARNGYQDCILAALQFFSTVFDCHVVLHACYTGAA